MSDYFFDEDRATAFKIDPLVASVINNKENDTPKVILVQTNVKITNFKKEKVRRILSEVYPIDLYDEETAKAKFQDTLVSRLIGTAKKISAEEYASIKAKVELM